ncbi:hypothetical protein [Methanobacterium sp. ACI-7]|uniref:hypothetical protein n=1 Tax=unclassified Methanobacterium TaxID=2627676 RepID=UPI0039C1CB1F
MKKVLCILLLFTTISVSGCTINKESQQTWGERELASLSTLNIINSTSEYEYYEENGINNGYFCIYGEIKNNYGDDAFNIKIRGVGYDKKGNIVASNKSGEYMSPRTIPANGVSSFAIYIYDPRKKIVDYKLEILRD